MKRLKREAVVIGGGPAGLAAAVALFEKGIREIVILEREKELGGILRQCIHDGFGLTRFGCALSGPEYAQKFTDQIRQMPIETYTNTSVLSISPEKIVLAASPEGLLEVEAGAVILAMGCRERTRGALAIPGERPAGVFTAGTVQAYVNLYNHMVGKRAVILGSGDIGLIMARRLTLEGVKVVGVFEILPYPSGLPRNIEQCLNDYGIPLFLSHTVTEIHGNSRITGVTVSEVDGKRTPIPGTEKEYSCDTLVISAGLIPENDLSLSAGVELDPATGGAIVDENYQTSCKGIFAAGNVLHVHDLVDFVSLESERMAESVARYLREGSCPPCSLKVRKGQGIGHVLPQKISGTKEVGLSFRVSSPIVDGTIRICQNGKILRELPRRRALPAEMIEMKIPAEMLSREGDLEVSAQ